MAYITQAVALIYVIGGLQYIIIPYHIQLSFSTESDREEESSNDTAGHGVVGVDDGTVLSVSFGQCSVEARVPVYMIQVL